MRTYFFPGKLEKTGFDVQKSRKNNLPFPASGEKSLRKTITQLFPIIHKYFKIRGSIMEKSVKRKILIRIIASEIFSPFFG